MKFISWREKIILSCYNCSKNYGFGQCKVTKTVTKSPKWVQKKQFYIVDSFWSLSKLFDHYPNFPNHFGTRNRSQRNDFIDENQKFSSYFENYLERQTFKVTNLLYILQKQFFWISFFDFVDFLDFGDILDFVNFVDSMDFGDFVDFCRFCRSCRLCKF